MARGCTYVTDPILNLKPSWEEFTATLSRNVKESLRKCYNAPKTHGLRFAFHVIERQDEVDAALAKFFELHQARSEMTGTIKHRNCFAAPRAKRFLTDVGSINLSTGVDVSKTRWSPRTTTYRAVEFSSQSRLARLKHDGFRAVSRRLGRGTAPSWLSRLFVRGGN